MKFKSCVLVQAVQKHKDVFLNNNNNVIQNFNEQEKAWEAVRREMINNGYVDFERKNWKEVCAHDWQLVKRNAIIKFQQRQKIDGDISKLSEADKMVVEMLGSENLLVSNNANVQQLRALFGTYCPTNLDKYNILKLRDDLLSKLRTRSNDVSVAEILRGTCPDMCPEKERYMRDVRKNLHRYECDNDGVMITIKTVKDYSRSAADQAEPLPHELRPPEVLQMTMNYLITEIANNIPSSESDLSRWYDFLWSRTRSIRKDITQQMLSDEVVADLVGKCTRLHIFASFRLAHLDESVFSQKMNTENLSKGLQTLRHMYDDMAQDGLFCKNEAEFRSYDILLNLADSNVHSQVLSYRQEIYMSQPVQLALELVASFQSNNYVQFFRILKKPATYLQACLCQRYFSAIRHSALKTIVHAYRMIPLDVISGMLAFNDSFDTLNFLSNYGIDTDFSDSSYINLTDARTKNFLNEINPVTIVPAKCQWIDDKMTYLTLPEVLCNEKCKFVELSEPVNSFDANDCYNLDPFNPYNPNLLTTQDAFEVVAPLKKSNFDSFFDTKLSIPVSLPETKQLFTGKKRQRRRSVSEEPPCKSAAPKLIESITNPVLSPKNLKSQNSTISFSQQPVTVPTSIVLIPTTPSFSIINENNSFITPVKPKKLDQSLFEDELKIQFFKTRWQEAREAKLFAIYYTKWRKFIDQKKKMALIKRKQETFVKIRNAKIAFKYYEKWLNFMELRRQRYYIDFENIFNQKLAIGFGRSLYNTKKNLQDTVNFKEKDEVRLCFIQSKCREMRKNIIARKYINKWHQYIEFKIQKRYVEV